MLFRIKIHDKWLSFRTTYNADQIEYRYEINNVIIPSSPLEEATSSLIRSEIISLSDEIVCFNQAFQIIVYDCKKEW